MANRKQDPNDQQINAVEEQQAEAFLKLLDPNTQSFTFQTFDDNKTRRDKTLTKLLHGSFHDHKEELISLNQNGAGVFVTVNETDLKGRKKENIKRVRAIFQENDGDAKDLPIEPHITVNTSPGHNHRYILTDTLDAEEFGHAMSAMVSRYGSDPGAKDICRVLRLPGFYHKKDPGNPFKVEIVEYSNQPPLAAARVKEVFNSQKCTSASIIEKQKSGKVETAIHEIISGESYHPNLLYLSAHYIGSGNNGTSTIQTLQGLMQQAPVKDNRWYERYAQIPDLVNSASNKYQNHVDPASFKDEVEIEIPDWPILSQDALPGIVGEFIKLATEKSEADPAAVLATFLTRFGIEVGPGPHLLIGDTPHRARLASVIVGASSKARKGTSGKLVERIFNSQGSIDNIPCFKLAQTTAGPFSSGEGIIYLIRDEIKKYDKESKQWVVVDPGVPDKRLFILDEEFAGVMAQTKREGNVLSMVIRQTWDNGTLAPIIKNNRVTATGGHVGWVSHITHFELNKRLNESEAFNGFANRILWICSKRSRLVPWPEPMDNVRLNTIQAELFKVIAAVNCEIVIKPDKETKEAWIHKYYDRLSRPKPGLLGAVTNRAETQTLRLTMIYCLLDGKTTIELQHLEAAVALWDYCEQSAVYIFHGKSQDQTARIILEALKNGEKTGTEINRLFSSHLPKAELETTLTELLATGRISMRQKKTSGRPARIYEISKSSGVKSVISKERSGQDQIET